MKCMEIEQGENDNEKNCRVVIGMMCFWFSILALAGCAQRNGQEAVEDAPTEIESEGLGVADGDLLSLIQERGELIVAMEGTWAP